MKKAMGFGLIFILVILLYFLYLTTLSKRAQKSYDNVEASKKLIVGQSVDQVLGIMGKPDTIYSAYLNKNEIIYYYKPPFAASSGIEIYFDSVPEVISIVPFE